MKRIIVADDDPAIQDALMMILTRAGYDTTVYANADDILAGNFQEPDVFLIDRQLHNIDGIDLCRFLKNRSQASAPVIIFSASSRVSELAKEAGADAFLEKPFKIKRLLELLDQMINRK